MKIRVNKQQAAYFRRKSRQAFPKEIQAFLVGTVVSPELTVVDSFHYPKEYHTQTTTEVCWNADEYQMLVSYADSVNKRIVGDAHSHPSWDAVMSPTDYKAHIRDGFRIAGICSTMDKKTRLRFWLAESSLPCEVDYI